MKLLTKRARARREIQLAQAMRFGCTKCHVPISPSEAFLSRQAMVLLVKREKHQDSVASSTWRDGPLCKICLAAWSASLAEAEELPKAPLP